MGLKKKSGFFVELKRYCVPEVGIVHFGAVRSSVTVFVLKKGLRG